MNQSTISRYQKSRSRTLRLRDLPTLLYLLTLFVFFAQPAEAKSNSALADELAQTRIQATRDLLQKDIQHVVAHIDLQEKRIDDVNAHIDHSLSLLGTSLSILGIVLTLAGVAGYISVQRKAEKQAKAAATEWFETNAGDLHAQLEALQDRLRQMEGQAETQVSQHIRRVQEMADEAQQQIQQNISEPENPQLEIATEAAEALAEVARAATNKPESEYTFQDWNNRAYAAYSENDKDGAARFWRKAAAHPSASPEAMGLSLFNAAVSLGELKRYDEAIATYDALIERLKNEDALALKEQVAMALLNKGHILGQMEQYDEALSTYGALIERFEKDNALPLREQVAKALVNKGLTLGLMKRYGEAIGAFDPLVERFDGDNALAIKEQVGKALVNKGITLGHMERYDEAIAVFDSTIERFGGVDDAVFKDLVAGALASKGNTLARAERYDEAVTVYDTVIAQFGKDDAPTVKKHMASAMNGKGYVLLCRAKAWWSETEKRNNDLQVAETLLGEAANIEPRNGVILGNHAYCAHLLGRPEDVVREKLVQAHQYGEASLYDTTLEDLAIHPVPDMDNSFRALVDEVWGRGSEALGVEKKFPRDKSSRERQA